MRSFIAVPTIREIQNKIAAIQAELISSAADVKWESSDKFHITLKFLGEVETSTLEIISATVMDIIHRFPPLEICYESLGVFPNFNNPRIVWMGARKNQNISNLQAQVEDACEQCGIPKEERAFHPHITLGRVKGSRNIVRLTEAIKSCNFDPMETTCSEIVLMKSDIRPSGSLYTKVHSFPFQT